MLGSNVYMSDLIGDAYTTWKDCGTSEAVN